MGHVDLSGHPLDLHPSTRPGLSPPHAGLIGLAGRGEACVEQESPTQRTEQHIVEKAENRLRSNPYLALKNVSCECHAGVLTLRGCLPTYFLKQMAQTAVDRLEGVQRIVNDIQVVSAGCLVPYRG